MWKYQLISYLEFQELLNFFLIICKILNWLLCHRSEPHEEFKHLCTLKCFVDLEILDFRGKILPRVQTFHRVSFDIPICDMFHSPQIYTFLSKTPHCSNSGDRLKQNKIIHFIFYYLTSQGRGALVALKQWRQWLLIFSLMSGHSIETLGSSTQIISPALNSNRFYSIMWWKTSSGY